jgi:hypothetical protein
VSHGDVSLGIIQVSGVCACYDVDFADESYPNEYARYLI